MNKHRKRALAGMLVLFLLIAVLSMKQIEKNNTMPYNRKRGITIE